nr:ABC transporter permease [Bacteriovorax sp. HI3]
MNSVFTVTKFTFLEVYRSKLMMSLVFLAMGLLLVTYVASEFAYGAPAKVALDVGLGIMAISNLIIAVFIGSTLLSKEIDQRTLYMILSRPISRASFLIGKILGLSTVLLLNSFLLGVLSLGLYVYYGGESLSSLFVWALYFSFLEAFIVLAFAVLFSLITNSTLSVIYTICIFIVGHALNETSKIFFVKISPFFKALLDIGTFFIPNFYRLNLKDFLIYKQSISLEYLLNTQLYIAFYLLALFATIIVIFKKRNLD